MVREGVDDTFVSDIKEEVEIFTDIFVHAILNPANKQTGDQFESNN
ncbi:hypothetical protein [Methanohalophilus sp. RSK]|nr:hypothetical protein [Methanohalophilus sp. RSK]